ncbi:hypothetical protein [Candidatus Avelusimicrobium caledoniensis]|uniref:hypothetical protein n=1 Tax=Candidatus Avelusimicrobium caledoniensis TaxID=3416220 RepID=UPI003D14CBE7
MIDRMKGGIEEEDVKEMWSGSAEDIKQSKATNPKNKPSVFYHHQKKQYVFDVAVPRCLFENNLEEATDTDLGLIVSEIQAAFARKGLMVSKKAIENAGIFYLEYGKNIILPVECCLLALFKRLGKCLTKGYNAPEFHHYRKGRRDGYKASVSNEGRDVGFYDKTTKEIVGKGYFNKTNRNIYTTLLANGKQVLRYEVTFYGSPAVKHYLSKFKRCEQKFTLQDVWDSNLIQQVLVSALKEVVDNLPPAGCSKETELKQIAHAIKQGVSVNDIAQYTGLETLERRHGAYTIKELFNPIEKRYNSQKAQYNQYADAKKKQARLGDYFKGRKDYVVRKIVRVVQNFKPLRLDYRSNRMMEDLQ